MWLLLLSIFCVLSLSANVLLLVALNRQRKQWADQKNYYEEKLQWAKSRSENNSQRLYVNPKPSVTVEVEDKIEPVPARSVPDKFSAEENNELTPNRLTMEWDVHGEQAQDLKRRNNIFFQRPTGEGHFQNSDASHEHKARFVYRVELSDDMTSGILHLEPKYPSDLDLIRNFPETLLEGACKYENSFSNKFEAVVQVAPGAVVSKGETWHIIEKVKIEFS